MNVFVRSLPAILVLVLIATPTAQARVRNDPLNANYWTAFLTHDAGKYGIEWDPEATSTDPPKTNTGCRGNPLDPCYPFGFRRTGLGDRSFGTYGAPIPEPVVFESPPLESTLVLNASRMIRVDLFILGTTFCNLPAFAIVNFEARLFAGGHFVGASVYDGYPNSGWANQVHDGTWGTSPKAPPGWCVYRLRIQPEADVLQEGSRLRLVILWYDFMTDTGFGMSGNHRSIIQIPFLPSEEIPFRIGARASVPNLGSVATDALEWVLPLVGAFAAPLVGRRRAGAPLLVLLFLGASVGGCLDSSRPSGPSRVGEFGGSIQATTLPDVEVAKDQAEIYGQVHDQFGAPIVGAAVSLLEADVLVKTAGFGQFRIVGLEPGTYTLRVERIGHKVFQDQVRVTAGEALRLDITLDTLVSDPNARSHLHDYWAGESTKVFRLEGLPPIPSCAQAPNGLPAWCWAPTFSLPTETGTGFPALIYPGTREIEVMIEWPATADPRFQLAGIMFQSPNDPMIDNWTIMAARAKGEPTRIQIGWEMADVGHQRFSQWLFRVWAPDNQTTAALDAAADAQFQASTALDANAGTAVAQGWGPLTVTIRLHKGIVPLEAAHPNRWPDLSSLTILDTLLKAPDFRCSDPVVCHPVDRDVKSTVNTSFAAPVLVPAETESLHVTLEQYRDTNPSFGWVLGYKGALSPQGTCAVDKTIPHYRTAPAPMRDGNTFTWIFAVDPADPDPPYARKTGWCFWLYPDNRASYLEDYCANSVYCLGGNQNDPLGTRTPLFLSFNVTLVRGTDAPR